MSEQPSRRPGSSRISAASCRRRCAPRGSASGTARARVHRRLLGRGVGDQHRSRSGRGRRRDRRTGAGGRVRAEHAVPARGGRGAGGRIADSRPARSTTSASTRAARRRSRLPSSSPASTTCSRGAAPGTCALTPSQLPRGDPVRARHRRSPVHARPRTALLTTTPKQVECYPYRCPFGEGHPCCDLACADDLERVIGEVGADSVSCYIAEPIVAAAGPGLTPPPGYYERIREICRARDPVHLGRGGHRLGPNGQEVRHRALGCGAGHDRHREGALRWLRPAVGGDLLRPGRGRLLGHANTPFLHNLTYEAHPLAAAAALAVIGDHRA